MNPYFQNYLQLHALIQIEENKIIVIVAYESPLAISDRNIIFTKTQTKLYHWTCSYYSSSILHDPYGKYIKSEKSEINDEEIKKEFKKCSIGYYK
ncbi:LOW QUALITY PROTEIN: hypothetical protein HZS_7140 [Henneguya salminicola]|nr:LOW QUALITY PROTEIN: hypothetical protein HZS_7140 [Henneguya salminicola]